MILYFVQNVEIEERIKKMYCEKCGSEIREGEAFCAKCGTRTGIPAKPAHMGNAKPAFSAKKMLKNKWFIGGLVAILIVVAVTLIVKSIPRKIELEPFVEVTYDGYDGYAAASCSVDITGLLNHINEELDLNFESAEDERIEKEIKAVQSVVAKLDKTTNVKNGDVLNVTLEYDNDLAKEIGVKFIGDALSVNVDGLEEPIVVNPFEGLEVHFSGKSPNGQMTYSYENDNGYFSWGDFKADKDGPFKNGDTVTFSIVNENSLFTRGIVCSENRKTFTVEGLEEYVLNYEAIPEDVIGDLTQDSEDAVIALVANDYIKSCSISDVKYEGYVFKSIKNADGWSDMNVLDIIVSGVLSDTDGGFVDAKVYFPVEYKNFLIGSGELSYSDYSIVGYTELNNLTWSKYNTRGYTNPAVAYYELTADADKYNVECGGGFEIYSSCELVESFDGITDECLEVLKSEAVDFVLSYIGKSYLPFSDEINYEGYYFLTSKGKGMDYKNGNKLYLVYSSEMESRKFYWTTYASAKVYFPVEYTGIVNLPDGTSLVCAYNGISGHTNSFEKDGKEYSSTDGYIEGEEMYKKIVSAQRDNYTYVVSDELKEFGE